MRRVYETLLQLYPRDYSELFAAEMLSAFEEAFEERRRHGSAGFLRFVLAELISLVRGVRAEWIAKTAHGVYHSSSYIGNSCLPDRHVMRPAGVARKLYFVDQTSSAVAAELIDEAGMCVNAHQRFVFASPLKRLLILTCTLFLPMHPWLGTKTHVWNRQD